MKKYIFIADWFSMKNGTIKWYDEGTAEMLLKRKVIEPLFKEDKPIDRMNKAELINHCKSKNITVDESLTKAKIIEIINS